MAYRRYSRSRSTSRGRTYRGRSVYSGQLRKAPRRKATRRAPQTVKLVIEHTGLSPIARPEAMGLVEKPKGGKAKF